MAYDGGLLKAVSNSGTWAPETSPTAMAVDGFLHPEDFVADSGSRHVDLTLSDPTWRITLVSFRSAGSMQSDLTNEELAAPAHRVEFPEPVCVDLSVTAEGDDYTARYTVRIGVAGAPCSPLDGDR